MGTTPKNSIVVWWLFSFKTIPYIIRLVADPTPHSHSLKFPTPIKNKCSVDVFYVLTQNEKFLQHTGLTREDFPSPLHLEKVHDV